MILQERILESEQKFEQKKIEREQHLKEAEECLTEMTKLQGEWRVLQDLLKEHPKAEEAENIEIVPEGEDK